MAKWLLGILWLFALQAAGAEDLKASVAPAFKKLISSGCIKKSEADHNLTDLGLSETEYCHCTSDRFVDSLTDDDIQMIVTFVATKKEGDTANNNPGEKLLGDPKLDMKMRSAAASCLFNDQQGGNLEPVKKVITAKCKDEMLKNGSSTNFTPEQVDDYCGCATDNIVQSMKAKTAAGEVEDFKQEGV